MKMPTQKPGRSEQSVGTDPLLIAAVIKRFGPITVDLAASANNTKAPCYLSEVNDSLKCDWTIFSSAGNFNAWVNPPFSNIGPWAEKCAGTNTFGGRIYLLVPASIGSNWFAEHVWNKAFVYALQGRLTFEGHTQPYPKDCILAEYGSGEFGFDIWHWKERRT